MLRSFGYVEAVSLRHSTAVQPDNLARLAPYAGAWRQATERAFLQAYLDTVGDAPVCPSDRAFAMALIDLFTIEKALYEVRYELANRPDWVGVPIDGLLRLLDSTRPGEPTPGAVVDPAATGAGADADRRDDDHQGAQDPHDHDDRGEAAGRDNTEPA